MKITLQTLTPLWTGGVDGTTDRLHETALIGSLRWWYEALVRGLSGYACDPTEKGHCEYNSQKPDPPEKQLCPACYLFGCTGWGRKFRLQVIGRPKIEGKGRRKAIQEGQSIPIEFIPLRKIKDEEWNLLQLTLHLISEYGAIGGKTVFKPSDELHRKDEFHHLDFGLVRIALPPDWPEMSSSLDDLKAYVTGARWRSGEHQYKDKKGVVHDYSWASLQNFWCVKGRYLARQNSGKSTFNRAISRKEPKTQAKHAKNKWLAGDRQESKKVFSFRHPAKKGRTFGFVKPGLVDFEAMKHRLTQAWPDFDPTEEFLTGEQILRALASQ